MSWRTPSNFDRKFGEIFEIFKKFSIILNVESKIKRPVDDTITFYDVLHFQGSAKTAPLFFRVASICNLLDATLND